MQRKNLLGLVAAVGLTVAGISPAQAADVYWYGRYSWGGNQENAQDNWTWATSIGGAGRPAAYPTTSDDVYFAANGFGANTFVWGDLTQFNARSLTFNSNVSAGFTFNGSWHDTRWVLGGSNGTTGYQIDVQAGAGNITFNNGSTNPDNAALVMNVAGTWNNASANILKINNVVKTGGNRLTKTGAGLVQLTQDQNGAVAGKVTAFSGGVTVNQGTLKFDKNVRVGTDVAIGIDPANLSSLLRANSFTFDTNTLVINLLGAPTTNFTQTIIQSDTGTITAGQFGTLASASYNSTLYQFSVLYNQAGGNNVVLSYTAPPVPEPASIALLGIAGLLLLPRRTKKA